MMRPVTVHVARALPDAPVLTFTRGSVDLAWTDGTPVDYTNPSSWTNPGTAEIGYRVERALVVNGTPDVYAPIATVGANLTTYVDNPPDPTETYSYRVVAWNAAGDSPSNVITVQGLPKAPINLTAVVQAAPALASGSQVSVGWANVATDATSIVLERAMGAGAFSPLATLAPTATSFVDTGVVPGDYSYRVAAVNAIGTSAWAGPVTVTVLQPASATVVLSAPNPSLVGTSVTFTATVSPVQASATPTGTVTFTVGGAATAVPLDAAGVATFSTATLAAGSHLVTADYGGDAMFQPSSAGVTQVVNQGASVTTLASSLNPSVLGDVVTFTASVSPASATGTVSFWVDGVAGTPVPVVAGTASFATAGLAVGGHVVFVSYSGDSALLPSSSAPLTQSVVSPLRATTTVVTSNRVPSSTFGQTVTFTATVRPSVGAGTPTGGVQFTVDGVGVGGLRTLNVQGRATYATAALSAGPHTVTATYSGSLIFASGTSAAYGQLVLAGSTTTSLSSSRNPSVGGQSVTFTARVVPAAVGNVQFVLDGSPLGAPVVVDATGRARTTTAVLSVGSHTVSATYLGTADRLPSSSAPLTQTVAKAASSTTVATSGSPVRIGTPVVFTATVRTLAPGTGIPTGTVQFTIDGITFGAPIQLNATGQAAFVTSSLAAGRHVVSASYSGDLDRQPSLSAGRAQVIR